MITTIEIMKQAKAAAPSLAVISEDKKNEAIETMAQELLAAKEEILKANEIDVENSRGVISDVMIDRLTLTSQRIEDMAKGMRDVAKLPDPVGKVLREHTLPNGLVVQKTSAGRHRHHLRKPSQCDIRCGGTGAEERQCLHPEGWEGSLPLRGCDREGPAERSGKGRAVQRSGAVGAGYHSAERQ